MTNTTHRRAFIAASLMAVFLFVSAGAQEAGKGKHEPLMIQEQGSFATPKFGLPAFVLRLLVSQQIGYLELFLQVVGPT
jgi:hypothetical protein